MGIGNWVKKGVVTFALATSKLEKDVMAQNGSEELLGHNQGQVQPYRQNKLMMDLKSGRLTQEVKEFRSHHYKLLKEVEKYATNAFGEVEVLTEAQVKAKMAGTGDPYDNYVVEVSVENKAISAGLLTESTVRPIKVKRGVFPTYKIEEHASIVHVRDIDGKNKLIEFCIPEYKNTPRGVIQEVENLMRTKKLTDFANILSMDFTAGGGQVLFFEYKMIAFDKVVQHNGNYIVKLFAEVVSDGRWLAEEKGYILD
jgi:hypothetical protein